ncbi:hypothetical protein BJF78_19870 [Pseudonocardia sp. CNS-139]|nr:hypothetical protein BJF78_19870 [Pseudonocardia sp. CNS-139]
MGRLDDNLHVIRVYDAGVLADGRPYLVTELCDSSLQQLVVRRGGALLEPESAELGYRVASALLGAHSAQVIHGDVTPQNVLIRSSGAPVLADFGLAVLRDHRGNTATGFNPAYAAPETLLPEGRIDERTDVYGLGATLYAMVTGRAPFGTRWGESEAERIRRVLDEPVSWPPGVAVSDRFHALVSAMLAKDPAERPALGAAADELARLREEPPQADAPPPDAADTEPTAEPGVVAGEAPATAEPERPHRRPVAVAAVVGLVIVVLVGAVVAAAGSGTTVGAAAGPSGPPAVTLAPPEPAGALATRLSWSGTPGLSYTLVVTRQGAGPRDESVGSSTSRTVATEPTVGYCL